EDLVQLGLRNRPEMAANTAVMDAAESRVRQARFSPLLPRVQLDYLGGAFGGGRNSFIGDFEARGDFTAGAYLELHNLGFGKAAEVRERRAFVDQTSARLMEVQAQVGAEVSEAVKLAASRFRTLDSAQQAVQQASTMYRKLYDATRAMVARGAKFEAV